MATKKAPNHNKDYITNRVLVIFSLCMVGLMGLMFLSNMLNSVYYMTGLTVLNVVMWVGIALCVMGVVLWVRQRTTGKDVTHALFPARYWVIMGLILAILMPLIRQYGLSMFKFGYALLVGIAFYYLIYHSYQPEFAVVAGDCAVAIAVIMLTTSAVFARFQVVFLALAAIAAVVQVILICKMRNGNLSIGNLNISHSFSARAYQLMLISPVLMLALALVGAFGSSTISFIAMGVAGAYFFVTGVYYTVKLV